MARVTHTKERQADNVIYYTAIFHCRVGGLTFPGIANSRKSSLVNFD